MKRNLSLDEARELKALTDAFVRNLKTTAEDGTDIEMLATQAASIVGSLKGINKDRTDLEQLDRQTGSIVTGLREMDDAENNKVINDEVAG